jgi:hypothetical protein
LQDDKMDALREDIDNLEEDANRHQARIDGCKEKVADFERQIADLPPPPQVTSLQLNIVHWPVDHACFMPGSSLRKVICCMSPGVDDSPTEACSARRRSDKCTCSMHTKHQNHHWLRISQHT